MDIDFQDLNDRIVTRFWRCNSVDKDEAEAMADIAVNEFKKDIAEIERSNKCRSIESRLREANMAEAVAQGLIGKAGECNHD